MKVNIYYSYDEITGDNKVKVLEVPDEILAMISSNYARYQNFLINLEDLNDRAKNSNRIKELLTKYKDSKWNLEKFIFDATGLIPCNDDCLNGYYGVENAETEETILEY